MKRVKCLLYAAIFWHWCRAFSPRDVCIWAKRWLCVSSAATKHFCVSVRAGLFGDRGKRVWCQYQQKHRAYFAIFYNGPPLYAMPLYVCLCLRMPNRTRINNKSQMNELCGGDSELAAQPMPPSIVWWESFVGKTLHLKFMCVGLATNIAS